MFKYQTKFVWVTRKCAIRNSQLAACKPNSLPGLWRVPTRAAREKNLNILNPQRSQTRQSSEVQMTGSFWDISLDYCNAWVILSSYGVTSVGES